MATISDYAELADLAYGAASEVAAPRDWANHGKSEMATGFVRSFQARAFSRNGEVVFAFAGTKLGQGNGRIGAGDIVTDLAIGVGMNSSQYAMAERFVLENRVGAHDSVTLCGHSLGGAIAQILGNRLRLPFVSFNAPGVAIVSRNLGQVAETLHNRPFGIPDMGVRMIGSAASALVQPRQAMQDLRSLFYWVEGVNFRVDRDPVSMVGVHYGPVRTLGYAGNSLNPVTWHSMAAMRDALAGKAESTMSIAAVIAAK